MSYATALTQLISVVEASTPSTKKRGYPKEFTHVPSSSNEKLPQERGFWFTYASGYMVGPMHPTFPHWIRAEMTLSVRYASDVETEAALDIIMQDYILLAGRLSNTANWNQPTSTIQSVNTGDAQQMPFTIDDVEGARILRISFLLDFKSPTSGGGF